MQSHTMPAASAVAGPVGEGVDVRAEVGAEVGTSDLSCARTTTDATAQPKNKTTTSRTAAYCDLAG